MRRERHGGVCVGSREAEAVGSQTIQRRCRPRGAERADAVGAERVDSHHEHVRAPKRAMLQVRIGRLAPPTARGRRAGSEGGGKRDHPDQVTSLFPNIAASKGERHRPASVTRHEIRE